MYYILKKTLLEDSSACITAMSQTLCSSSLLKPGALSTTQNPLILTDHSQPISLTSLLLSLLYLPTHSCSQVWHESFCSSCSFSVACPLFPMKFNFQHEYSIHWQGECHEMIQYSLTFCSRMAISFSPIQKNQLPMN